MVAVVSEHYRAAIQRVLEFEHRAYLATSEPAPHPVRWKRWLRRPYRKVDHAAFLAEMRKFPREPRERV
jgi:hypothetical protein